MSSEAIGWAIRHSPFKGVAYLVHLHIADSVNDQHQNEFWLRLERLAIKCRASRSAVQDSIRALVSHGYLTLLDAGGGKSRPARYRFEFLPSAQVFYDSKQKVRESHAFYTVQRRGDTVQSDGLKGVRVAEAKNSREPKELKDGNVFTLKTNRLRDVTAERLARERSKAKAGGGNPMPTPNGFGPTPLLASGATGLDDD